MTLNFYLISTIISLIVDTIMQKIFCSKDVVEKKGYKFTKKEEHQLRKLLLFLLDKLYCFIPIINIMTPIGVVIGYITEEYMYFTFGRSHVLEEYIAAKLLTWEKQGKIYNVNEFEFYKLVCNIFTESAAQIRENEKAISETKEDEKTYNEMTNEEKLAFLQEEREKIMKSINSTSSSPLDEEEPPTSNNSRNKTYTLKK